MYEHPANDEFARQCLMLWGVRLRFGGPAGYPRDAAFVPKARGINPDWHDDITETVGKIVNSCLDDEQRMIVKRYFEPLRDDRKPEKLIDSEHDRNVHETKQCNMTLVIRSFQRDGLKVDRNRINQALDRAIGKVSMALSYPSMVIDTTEDRADENKVCNL